MDEALWYELRNAVYAKEFEIAEALLRANPHVRQLRDGVGETVLHFLAVENDAEGVAWLYKRGFDLDSKNKFGTPVIFEVAELGYKDLLLWFAQEGVNFSALGRDGTDILKYLRANEKKDMAQFLIEKVPNLVLQATPASGRG
jgi:ankyrin repeat protein